MAGSSSPRRGPSSEGRPTGSQSRPSRSPIKRISGTRILPLEGRSIHDSGILREEKASCTNDNWKRPRRCVSRHEPRNRRLRLRPLFYGTPFLQSMSAPCSTERVCKFTCCLPYQFRRNLPCVRTMASSAANVLLRQNTPRQVGRGSSFCDCGCKQRSDSLHDGVSWFGPRPSSDLYPHRQPFCDLLFPGNAPTLLGPPTQSLRLC